MFGDLTEAFGELDRREFMSPRHSGNVKKTKRWELIGAGNENDNIKVSNVQRDEFEGGTPTLNLSPSHSVHFSNIHQIKEQLQTSASHYANISSANHRLSSSVVKLNSEKKEVRLDEERRTGGGK